MKKTVDSVIYEHLVIFIFLWEVLRAEQYVIIRRRSTVINTGTTSTVKVQPDRFIIPSSSCVGNGSVQCKVMGGSRVGNCTCECNRMASDGASFSSSTFGFDGGRWKCLENTKVHERSGCSVILNYWANDSSLITVPKAGVADYEIPSQFRSFHIYKATSKAQKCDNSWMHLDYDTYVKERFSVHRVLKRQYLKFNYSGNSSQQIMSGRVIKLGVGYHNASNKIIHTCVLLKMQGELKCPFSQPTTATPSTTDPSPLSSVFLTPTESNLSTSTYTSSTVTPNTHTASSGSPTVNMSTDETSVPIVIKTSTQNTSSEDRSALIASAAVGGIALIVLVSVIILVRKRKIRENVTKRTSVVAEENGFGTNRVQPSLEDQDEYSYAYASAVSINKRHMDHHPENRAAQNDVTNFIYGATAGSPPHSSNNHKDPDHKKLKKPQQQNILEPEYAKVNKTTRKTTPSNKQDEPLYNVLEGPDGTSENEPPCYHVLEEPYPDSGPVYDVLEEPGSMPPHLQNQNSADGTSETEPPCYHVLEEPYPDSGPVYDVLEEPGSMPPHLQNQNSACKRPNTRSGVENRGYNDTVYDAVEEVIPDTGDTYQNLNQDNPREPRAYQTLTYANQAMPLTKFNAAHSEA